MVWHLFWGSPWTSNKLGMGGGEGVQALFHGLLEHGP